MHAQPDPTSELLRLRATCRSHERALDGLSRACATLRRGAVALKAENAMLRAELDRVRSEDGLEPLTMALPAEIHAPAAARCGMRRWLTAQVPDEVLDDAQLVVSELLTNSLRHAGVTPHDVLHVRVELADGVLRLEVEDPGTEGSIAPSAPDYANGSGFGLNLVESLSSRWGVTRNGNTGVWAELTWPPNPSIS
jgi:serine/threonine-protein kinase RsbW